MSVVFGIIGGAKKVAHYWYSDGNQLVVFVKERQFYIRDGRTGHHPVCPVRGIRFPYPGDGTEIADWSYETLGLYYDYEMDAHAPDRSPCDMPKFIDTDPELAWWNGEEGGEEPQ